VPNKEIEIEKKWLQLSLINSDEFVRFYEKYSDRVYKFVLVKTSNVDAAEDITSETFAVALDKLSEFRWMGYTYGAWLFKIAVQLVYQHNRYVKKISNLDLVEESELRARKESALARLVKTESEQLLLDCLDKLDDQSRTMLELHYWGDLKVREIAVVLGVPKGTVQSHLKRDREKVRKMMEERT
jgi:RNA polymerase sigma-70 factor, ECF subfamily